MLSTFFGVEIARRGLLSNRGAMDVTAHNLANANTEGYTRQDPLFAATEPYTTPNLTQKLIPGQIGTGVEVGQIRRIRDALLDGQVRDALSQASFWEERRDILKRVEAVFPEPSDMGIESLLGKFFNAWQELNNNPQDLGVKAVVREAGSSLATAFRQHYRQLAEIKRSLEEEIELKTTEINRIAGELVTLNVAIKKIVDAGNQPNDLLDRQDLLLDELARLAQIEVTRDEHLRVEVSVYGEMLVKYETTLEDFSRVTSFSPGEDERGALAGTKNAYELVESYLDGLDELAAAICEKVNDRHGSAFFEFEEDREAETMDIDGEIKNDLNEISGENALKVASLRFELTMSEETTFEGFYRSLVAGIGADVEGAASQVVASCSVKEQLEDLRQSISGVSLDEELTRLTQFQYAYQASARVLAAMDEILDTLINRLR